MQVNDKVSPFKNRSRASIVNDILIYCKSPILQTHIMYKANLSYSTLKIYVDMLVRSGLLEVSFNEELSTRVFSTTNKGLRFLEQTKVLNGLLGVEEAE
ncbi:MAG: winged helix-turn-helix domain-containing protein [Nitrososphaerales archaeon]